MRNDNNLVYIGAHCYERHTLLIDLEVLEVLQRHPHKTPTEQINELLRKELLENE